MRIILQDEEVGHAIRSLEFYISMHLGQYDRLSTMHRFMIPRERYDLLVKDEKERECRFLRIRNILMPELAGYSLLGANRGVFQSINDPSVRDAYDVSQVIHQGNDEYRRMKEKDLGQFHTPIFSGRYAHPRATAYGTWEKKRIALELCMEQLLIMIVAADVYICAQQGRIRDMFSYLTQDTPVLEAAEEIDELLPRPINDEEVRETVKYREHLRRAKKRNSSGMQDRERCSAPV